MGWFGKKRSSETIDFTELEKRGLVDKNVLQKENNLLSEPISRNTENTDSGMDFLSSLAAVGNSNTEKTVTQSPGPIVDSLRDARRRGQLSTELNEMRNKMDDTDFKLNNLMDQVRQLEEKLRVLERR